MIVAVVAIYESMLLIYELKNMRFLVQQLQVAYPTYSSDNLSRILLACFSVDSILNCVMVYVASKTIHSHLTSSFESFGSVLLVCMGSRLALCYFNL